jgi:hypothetical protein
MYSPQEGAYMTMNQYIPPKLLKPLIRQDDGTFIVKPDSLEAFEVTSVPECKIEDILPAHVLADGCDPDPRKPATQAIFEPETGGEA